MCGMGSPKKTAGYQLDFDMIFLRSRLYKTCKYYISLRNFYLKKLYAKLSWSSYYCAILPQTCLCCNLISSCSCKLTTSSLVAGVVETVCLHNWPSSSHSFGGKMVFNISSVSFLTSAAKGPFAATSSYYNIKATCSVYLKW